MLPKVIADCEGFFLHVCVCVQKITSFVQLKTENVGKNISVKFFSRCFGYVVKLLLLIVVLMSVNDVLEMAKSF